MNLAKWERFKFFILLILIFTSVIQVGILWSFKKYGAPHYFFSEFFNKKNIAAQRDLIEFKENLFLPSRVIVSKDIYSNNWLVDKEDEDFPKLYADMKLYLADILTKGEIKYDRVIPLKEDTTLKFMAEPSITFEFSTNINSRMLPWLLDFSGVNIVNKEISSIKKVIIIPNLLNEKDSCTIEIIDEASKKVFEYNRGFKDRTGMGKDWYRRMMDDLGTHSPDSSYSLLTGKISGINSNSGITIPKDMLFLVPQMGEFSLFRNYTCASPGEFIVKDENTSLSDKQKKLAEKILGNDAESFLSSVDLNGTATMATFKNVGNTYKVHSNGLLEYHYLQAEENDNKGKLEDAFEKITEFIGSKLHLIVKPKNDDKNNEFSDIEIYLSSFEEKNDKYKFTFDYRLNNVPVFFNFAINDKGKRILNSAIEIEATGKRVLNCYWIIKEFTPIGDKTYNLVFTDVMDNLSKTRPDIKSIKNIYSCYEVRSEEGTKVLEPLWLIEPDKEKSLPVKVESFTEKMNPK
ncbi:hypothetical protein [Pseudobacteroides cellulosolvens]|nr:hypothetical protein [Pseudobacteroides cellulosolvens]